ncbi:MAG: DUF1850 domain-containing protein [Desulfobacteraceae bacterium]|nr:DUF1850 domain-containing protein [Desulfobacteraceae bacterium]
MTAHQKKYWFISIFSVVLVILAILGFFFFPRYEVRIENASENKTIHRLKANPGNNLWLIHINSVEKLPVAELYEIAENYQFSFSEVIYQAPYVGYLNSGKAKVIAPGTIRISDFSSPMEEVSFFAGDISKHMMFWNGKWLPLYEGAGGGDLIRITIEKISGFNMFLLKRKLSHGKE